MAASTNTPPIAPAARWGLFVLLLALIFSAPTSHAQQQGPWKRHTIDNTSRGADGVRLGDINGDGLQDIATGWEEGGLVRVYLNPGKAKAKKPWPKVTVGKVKNVEDAVFADLDNDGTLDVISSCEGKTKTMYVHWGPKDKKKLLDEKAWKTEPIPATVGKQMWMYCLPLDTNYDGRVDLVTGSKGKGAAVGWLESPKNPRDLKGWRYHKIKDAGWIMSLQYTDTPSVASLLVTDRKGPNRGVYKYKRYLKQWGITEIHRGKHEYMFGWAVPNTPRYAVATRDGSIKLFREVDIFTAAETGVSTIVQDIPNPFGTKAGKAVAVGIIDNDKTPDYVVSFNTQREKGKNKPGVAWIQVDPEKKPDQWKAYDISGPKGKKFDRIELIDMDGDGDLDVLTCEEADNLGVIWYENPYGKAKRK